MFKLSLALMFALSAFTITAQAQDDADLLRASSCRAREIERFYCPSFDGGQWWGPYWDRGCSVTCRPGQKAVCREAHCDDDQSGQPVDSSCTCR